MTDAASTISRHLPDARRGDRRAFAELVKSTQTTVTSIALAIVRVSTLVAGGSPPPSAVAASAALGAKSAAKVTALGGLGLLLGAAGGIAGIVLGLRPYLRAPFDEREGRALLRQQRLGILFVLLAIAGFAAVAALPGWQPALAVYALFVAAITWHSRVALPRILAPRLAAARAADPGAAARQARQRLTGLAGLAGGALAGLAGLLLGLANSGRLG